jgi:predicted TIM-barrel fold metal-dependent hydrolase
VIIDTHTHVVSRDDSRYPLNPSGVGTAWYREAPLPIEDLASESAAIGINAVVLVQAYGAYTYDNTYVVDAAQYDLARFVSMAIVDAEDPNTPATLRELATRPGFAGIRLFPLGDPARPQPEWLDDPRTFAVWETCAELGLRIAVAMLPVQFARLRAVLARFPEQVVALDHCGFADFTGGPPFSAAAPLFECAAHDNLHLKVTSTVLEAVEADGHEPAAAFERLVAEFGARRLMWGSDYPQTRDRPYGELLALARRGCDGLASADADLVLGGTAAAIWPELASASAPDD